MSFLKFFISYNTCALFADAPALEPSLPKEANDVSTLLIFEFISLILFCISVNADFETSDLESVFLAKVVSILSNFLFKSLTFFCKSFNTDAETFDFEDNELSKKRIKVCIRERNRKKDKYE